MTTLHIENRDDIVKHKESAAILAADLNAFKQHLNRRKKQSSLEKTVMSLEQRVSELEIIIAQLNTRINDKGNI